MLTRRQHDLLEYLRAYIAEHGYSPSLDQMKEALGYRSKAPVHDMLGRLEERGHIRRLKNRARAIEVSSPGNEQSFLQAENMRLRNRIVELERMLGA